MKKLIHEVADVKLGSTYQLWAELNDCLLPAGYKSLKFTTEYVGSTNKDAAGTKGEFFLPPDAVKNLSELLNA